MNDKEFSRQLIAQRNDIANKRRRNFIRYNLGLGLREFTPITGYSAPEVTIRPTGVAKQLKQAIPDDATRADFYKESASKTNMSESDYAKKVINLWNYAGRPKIGSRSISNVTAPLTDVDNVMRANYLGNTMYLPHHSFKEYVAELPHAIHHNDSKLGKYRSTTIKEADQYLTLGGGDREYVYNGKIKNNYKNPNHYENFAHDVIQPSINAYLSGKYKNDFHSLLDIYNKNNITNNKSEINAYSRRFDSRPVYYGYVPIRRYRSGGTIHINPANRGKFNATKKRTGKTTEELTHSKNPKTRKRAIFAQNAAKWRKRS